MRPKLAAVPPHGYFVVSAIFHYLGPAFAVLLFARVDVLGVAYLAIDRLPLGTVAAIEFVPVIALAAAGARTGRNALALAVAAAGVYVLTDVRIAGEPLGFVFAFANAGLFALYIVLGHRVAQRGARGGIDGLGASMLVALLVVTPIGGWAVAPALTDLVAIAAGVAVGICSSVIPYVADQLAMARLPRATYALLVALLPATATIVGVIVLSQLPSAVEALGVGLVVLGVAVHRERRQAGPAAAPVTLSS